MRTLRTALLFLLALPAAATTYVVPDDRGLVSLSRAIVSGTVVESRVRRGSTNRIETVTTVGVDEWIKGVSASGTGRTIDVVLPGGELDDVRLSVPGVPAFTAGERVLLFLSQTGRGEWTTWAFALGAFRADGRGLLVRDEVFGWDPNGERHIEQPRLKRAFVDYVRAVARGEDAKAGYFAPKTSAFAMLRVQPNASTFTPGSYSYQPAELPLRRNGAVAEWRVSGKTGDLDVEKSADVAVAAWSAVSPAFHDTHGPDATGNTDGDDAEWRILANDPLNDIPDTCCVGILAATYLIDKGAHVFNGETFRTLTHADLVINDGMSAANFRQDRLNDVVAHEIGHTLALRHSDKNGKNDAACSGNANCCIDINDEGNCVALMNSTELADVTGIQTWDRDAMACLYEGKCTRTCVAPSILEGPRGDMMFINTSVVLSTRGRATPPFTLTWYAGEKGDTSKLVASGKWNVRVQPTETTKYWMRIKDECGQIDSDAALMTVVRCPAVRITSVSATIVAPNTVKLSVRAGGGDRYRWYRSQGPGLPGSLLGLKPEITVTYQTGQTFWVTVANTCGNGMTSVELTPSATPPPSRPRRVRH